MKRNFKIRNKTIYLALHKINGNFQDLIKIKVKIKI